MFDDEYIRSIERPRPVLLTYFLIGALATGPAFPVVFLVRFFKYRTLRYRFDDEGVSMSWGLLFRREIHLTYSRIQDIHLRSNVVERWLGLARLQIQTASGSANAEMTVIGILEYEALRDFIYARMRGARDAPHAPSPSSDLTAVLQEVARELRELKTALERHPGLSE